VKAWEWRGGLGVDRCERPAPRPASHEVLLRPTANGVCATDLELVRGRLPDSRPPLVPGHEIVARVVAGAAGTLVEGTRVVVDTMVGCGRCAACRRGETQLCRAGTELGLTRDGGWRELLTVPAANCHRLPDGLADRTAVLVEPLSCQLGALRGSPPQARGDRVLVIGSGVAALLFAQLAPVEGAAGVTLVVDDEDRAELARRLGASEVLVAPGRPPTDSEFAIAIDAVGSAETLALAVDAVRPGGHVTLYGLGAGRPEIPLHACIFKNLTLSGHTSAPWLWEEAIELAATGAIQLDPLITDAVEFDDVGGFLAGELGGNPLNGRQVKAVIHHA
jgi:threonine dehydrogenase-like Zn-dependent dehydrogenase